MNRDTLRAWLREPFVHFLGIGLVVFAVSAWRGEPADPASRTIEIDAPHVSRLAENFTRTWRRTPSAEELDGLIRDYVQEEIYYREALRLGLEADDPIIRKRLRSKMEFLAASEAENIVPDEASLQAWLNKNASRYALEARRSFDQIFLATNRASPDRIAAIRTHLAAGGDWRGRGDPLSLPPSLENQGDRDIDRVFGTDFSGQLAHLPLDQWSGPIPSGFGVHLVRVRAVTPGRLPVLADVRQQVENDWRAATAKAREEKAFRILQDSYTIKIAVP